LVALVGFTAAEYGTFETFFRLVSSRRPRPFKASRDLAGASLVMLNTAEASDIERVFLERGADQRVISVGHRRVENAWRHLDRPINLNAVLMAIDAALSDQAPAMADLVTAPATATATAITPLPVAAEPVRIAPIIPVINAPIAPQEPSILPVTVTRQTPTVVAPVAAPAASLSTAGSVAPKAPVPPVRASATPSNVTPFPAAGAARATNARSEPANLADEQGVTAPPLGAARVNILVVDDSDVALKFIHSRLSAFGFTVDKCKSGEEALVRVADGEYQFVFLDVMMAGLDGYQTCKAIKARRYTSGKPPTVVMLTSRGGTIDKVRGTFAGCDAYLTKPLDETKMLKVLLKHDADIGRALSTMPTSPAAPPPRSALTSPNPLAAAYEGLSNSGK
jgi:CheY-like chemotaxis protein